MTMIWATPDELRAVVDAHAAAYGVDEWPPLPEADVAVQTLIDSASRTLGAKVIRWPILDDADRPEDVEQRAAVVQAVAEVIRARLVAVRTKAELGGQAAASAVASGGRVKAGNLEVQGGTAGGSWLSPTRVPWPAYEALQAAGMIGGGVATW